MIQAQTRPDYAAITDTQQQTWASGDFSVIAVGLVPVAETLVASADPRAGQRVLDVACGNGNTAIAAARRYSDVTGVDYVPALLERGKQRARAEGVEVRFVEGDAQALPFPDGQFDCVLSTFGVMFAPDQPRAAHEILRVCRDGGTIALACWTPAGVAGEFFRTVAKVMPPPPGLQPPTRWGTEQGVRELFGARASAFRFEARLAMEYFRSVDHAVDTFRQYFGPTYRAFQKLDAAGQRAFADELAEVFRTNNRSNDGTLVMAFEYLETVITVGSRH